MSHVDVVSFYNLIGTARPRRRKSTTFPRMLPGSLLPPFLKREPGDKATKSTGLNLNLLQSLTACSS